MKGKKISLLWVFAALFVFAFQAKAQDDLYYDPSTDAASTPEIKNENYGQQEENNVTRRYEDNDDSAYNNDDDDYAYEYSSRIRRFHRPSFGVDYYDPFFVDLYYYDPFFSPGASIYVYNYNDYWTWRQWRRWNRWNNGYGYDYSWGAGYNPWGWSSCYSGYSPWYNPWVSYNYYYDPYWTWNGYNPYYGGSWSTNHYNYDNGNSNGGGYSPQTYTGVRRHGTTVNPGYARIPDGSGRLNTPQKNVPVVEKSIRQGNTRTAGDFDPASKPATRSTAPANSRRVEPGSSTRNAERSGTIERAERPTRTMDTDNSRRVNPGRSTESRPSRDVTPSRRNDNSSYSPRREESRPARRAEEQRSNTPSRSTESRPSRSESSSPRSYSPSPSRSSSNESYRSSGGSSERSSGSSERSSSGSSSRSSSGGRHH